MTTPTLLNFALMAAGANAFIGIAVGGLPYSNDTLETFQALEPNVTGSLGFHPFNHHWVGNLSNVANSSELWSWRASIYDFDVPDVYDTYLPDDADDHRMIHVSYGLDWPGDLPLNEKLESDVNNVTLCMYQYIGQSFPVETLDGVQERDEPYNSCTHALGDDCREAIQKAVWDAQKDKDRTVNKCPSLDDSFHDLPACRNRLASDTRSPYTSYHTSVYEFGQSSGARPDRSYIHAWWPVDAEVSEQAYFNASHMLHMSVVLVDVGQENMDVGAGAIASSYSTTMEMMCMQLNSTMIEPEATESTEGGGSGGGNSGDDDNAALSLSATSGLLWTAFAAGLVSMFML